MFTIYKQTNLDLNSLVIKTLRINLKLFQDNSKQILHSIQVKLGTYLHRE